MFGTHRKGSSEALFRSVLRTPICGKHALRRPLRALRSVKAVGTSDHRPLEPSQRKPQPLCAVRAMWWPTPSAKEEAQGAMSWPFTYGPLIIITEIVMVSC
jgi:hypothetical protein